MKRDMTAKLVERPPLPPASKDRVIYWDQSLSRLGLMVTNKGHKSWIVQYRVGGRSRRITLDGVLSLAASGNADDLAIARDFVEGQPRNRQMFFTTGRATPTIAAAELPVFLIPGNHDRYQDVWGTPGGMEFDRISLALATSRQG